jgi:hypothetical protein
MRKIVFLLGLVLSAAGLAHAQLTDAVAAETSSGGRQAKASDQPALEVFAGAGIMRDGATSGNTLYGGLQFEGSYNFLEHLGATADLSWEHRSIAGVGISQWHYLFGPRYSWRKERATLFGHFLLGGNSLRAAGGSTSGFAFGMGGGVDYNATRKIAIRGFQVDYIPSRLAGTWFHDFRIGAGVVFKIGRE